MSTDYEALALRAERGELDPIKRTELHGADAAAAGRAMLINATGADSIEDAISMTLGRPRVGEERGVSPTIRARVPRALKESLAALAKQDQRPESDIIREAVAQYIQLRQSS